MEKYDVINAINKEIEREKDLCRKYVKLNPSDKDRREYGVLPCCFPEPA